MMRSSKMDSTSTGSAAVPKGPTGCKGPNVEINVQLSTTGTEWLPGAKNRCQMMQHRASDTVAQLHEHALGSEG